MASKSKGRGKSMKMGSSTQLLMLVVAIAVLYMIFNRCRNGSAIGTSVASEQKDWFSGEDKNFEWTENHKAKFGEWNTVKKYLDKTFQEDGKPKYCACGMNQSGRPDLIIAAPEKPGPFGNELLGIMTDEQIKNTTVKNLGTICNYICDSYDACWLKKKSEGLKVWPKDYAKGDAKGQSCSKFYLVNKNDIDDPKSNLETLSYKTPGQIPYYNNQ